MELKGTTVWTHQDPSCQRLSRYHDSGPVFDRGHPAHLAGRCVVLVGALDAIASGDSMDLLIQRKGQWTTLLELLYLYSHVLDPSCLKPKDTLHLDALPNASLKY